jgi:hypothetical protein
MRISVILVSNGINFLYMYRGRNTASYNARASLQIFSDNYFFMQLRGVTFMNTASLQRINVYIEP